MTEIFELSDRYFEVAIVKMIQELKEMLFEISEKTPKSQKRDKNIKIQMKNSD